MREISLYTDGSFNKAQPEVTKGAAIILEDDKPVYCQRYLCYQPSYTASWNFGGELFAISCALGTITRMYPDDELRICIYYDYQGVEHYIQGKPVWRVKNEPAAVYVNIVNKLKQMHPKWVLDFKKVKAHSGNKWNEAVDKLTRGSCDAELTKVRMQDFEVR